MQGTGSVAGLSALLLFLASVCAWTQGVSLFPPPGAEGTGERELKALAAAYPDRISKMEQRQGDWAVQVDGQWFAWAHGRILPESRSAAWETYSRYRFYPYSLEWLPPLPKLDDETAARLSKILQDMRVKPPRRSDAFLDSLFDAGSRARTESRITTVDFLGFSVRVHERIAAPLQAVVSEIQARAKVDPDVTLFLRGLSEIDGFNYRDVAGTLSRSYHSYGLALDLIPRSYRGKDTYWRWAAEKTAPWWSIPYEDRWLVPAGVVSAFERQGFVWGGKWLFFDTMHFEYRPEIFALARGGGNQ